MVRGRNIGFAFRCIAAILTWFVLPRVAASQSATVTDPPGFHLLLRPDGGKTTYKLGDPVLRRNSLRSEEWRKKRSPVFCRPGRLFVKQWTGAIR